MAEQLTLEQGLAEAERLRPQRVTNYAVKRAANFTCQHQGCTASVGVLVVEVGDRLQTRCFKHIGRYRPTPGQWVDRSAI